VELGRTDFAKMFAGALGHCNNTISSVFTECGG
jgi:hypothetical protein